MRARGPSWLGEIARANLEATIDSYPFFYPRTDPTNVVRHARDAQKLGIAKRAVENMLEYGSWTTNAHLAV
jgi:hypothetical protein